MAGLIVRRARNDELDKVVGFNAQLFKEDAGQRDPLVNQNWPQDEGKEYFLKRIEDDERICLVAEMDGKLVGYLAGSIKGTETWRPVKRTELENMFVMPEFRSKGVGRELVNKFKEWSKEKGVERVLVVAYASNERAIEFYKKSGFVPDSVGLEADI